jgi:hypothetical protein
MIESNYIISTNRKAAVFFALIAAVSAVSAAIAPAIIHT